MAAKPFIAARISEDLNLKLDDYSKATGESRTQILLNALSTYLGYSPNSETKERASDRLTRLEEKVVELERILKESKQFLPIEEGKNESKESIKPEIQSDNINDNKPDNRKQEKPVQGVINIDNNKDNIPDNDIDNITDNSQTSIVSEAVRHPDSQYGEYLGQMKSKEVMKLPELKTMDPVKLRNKLTATKRLKTRRSRIDPYTLFLTLLDKDNSKKQEFLWDVYKSENALITVDNT